MPKILVKTIFDFIDYKAYLASYIRSQPAQGRGLRARMADAMECQRGFVTKVLDRQSSAHFSLEQAERLNAVLDHSADEANFFLTLVQLSRAGTRTLRDHFMSQLQGMLIRRLDAKKEFESRRALSPEDHITYFSAWYYSAIRVGVSIPALQTKEALSQTFQLPMTTINSVLDFLTSRGLVEQQASRFIHVDKQQILLNSDHPLVSRNHVNWRLQALKTLDVRLPNDLHYSYVVTISEQDALRIRSVMVGMIKDVLELAAPSKEERLYAFCLDYFEL